MTSYEHNGVFAARFFSDVTAPCNQRKTVLEQALVYVTEKSQMIIKRGYLENMDLCYLDGRQNFEEPIRTVL